MAPAIHMLKPGNKVEVFGDFAALTLIPFLENHVTPNVTTRLDGVWESYIRNSIKAGTHDRRGQTANKRTRVSAQVPMPKGKEYQKFLNDINNKDKLFQFLADELMDKMRPEGCNVVTTKREYVLSTKELDVESISPSNHEEGDTKLLLHLKHAVLHGHEIAYMRTVDIMYLTNQYMNTMI